MEQPSQEQGSTDPIKILTRKRGYQKQRLTVATAFLNKAETDVGSVQQDELTLRLTALSNIAEEFQKIHELILETISDDASENDHMQYAIEFDELILTTRARMIKIQKSIDPSNKQAKSEFQAPPEHHDHRYLQLFDAIVAQGNNAEARNANLIQQFAEMRVAPAPKLPTLQLPTFSGDYKDYVSYRDSFKGLMSNNRYDDALKLRYLQSTLSKEPKDLVSELEKNPNGYELAWEVLEKRYSKKRVTIDSHLQLIYELPKVSEKNAAEMRQTLGIINKQLKMLEQYKLPVEQWDVMLVHLIKTKLSDRTLEKWNESLEKDEMPSCQKLLDFLDQRCTNWEEKQSNIPSGKPLPTSSPKNNVVPNHRQQQQSSKTNQKPSKPSFSYAVESETPRPSPTKAIKRNLKCDICQGDHFNFKCPKFLGMSVRNRRDRVKILKLCFCCLRPGHQSNDCTLGNCQLCKSKHNTLLHLAEQDQASTSASAETTQTFIDLTAEQDEEQATSACVQMKSGKKQILLATAVVDTYDKRGRPHPSRTLLDSASQSNFVTQKFAKQLNLNATNMALTIRGITGIRSSSSQMMNITIRSKHQNLVFELGFHVVPQIVGKLPASKIDISNYKFPDGIKLADPNFNVPSDIDMLIGSEAFFQLLLPKQVKLGLFSPVIQQTKLGWIVAGNMSTDQSPFIAFSEPITAISLSELMQQFWKLECFPHQDDPKLTIEEKACEDHFVKHVRRDSQGRFEVKLPFAQSPTLLGNSFNGALACFLRLEKRLQKDPTLLKLYSEFMNDYCDLGHMREIEFNPSSPNAYYMPHLAVLRPKSRTTKLRTVFNASYRTTTGISLNDILMVGPIVQQDLVSIILQFRKHQVVFVADLKKMFRQIKVYNQDYDYQRIIWRSDPSQKLRMYQLTTVTYGTAPASYLASRCLNQLAHEEKEKFPLAAKAISNFYMDDCMTGADTIQEALKIQSQLIQMLNGAGLEMHKWVSNCPELLSNVNKADQHVKMDQDPTIKTLGLFWNPDEDFFYYQVNESATCSPTKRTILSEISKLFDPIGILSPVILVAKLIMRMLWEQKIEWDDQPSQDIKQKWIQYQNELSSINNFKVPRWLHYNSYQTIQIHGFCDASQIAYGACIYLLSRNEGNDTNARLICAKSRIAPIKSQSIPRLELCGAQLLAQLIKKVLSSIAVPTDSIFCWSDSTIVLTWIQSDSARLTSFVQNRVTQIQENSVSQKWNFVNGTQNPADILSRGSKPNELIESKLWWNGPDWLCNFDPSKQREPPKDNSPDCLIEFKSSSIAATATIEPFPLLDRYESINKTIRTMAYCLRFAHNCRNNVRKTGELTPIEFDSALLTCVKIAQAESFPQELEDLTKSRQVEKSSRLLKFNPFLNEGIIRVGGRLANSLLPFDQQKPMVLPSEHPFAKHYARSIHLQNQHCGPQLMLSIIRQRLWLLRGGRLAANTVKNCLECFRAKPTHAEQMMADLPANRVQQNRVFVNVGVDFAGPMKMKTSKIRNAKLIKVYVALFVCFATKAIHLELVTELTTDAFIAALKRFIARRGLCANIYSDKGSNFVGASNDLHDLYSWLSNETNQTKINQHLLSNRIRWHFNPTESPHRGGLWESGVKSVKHHLRRAMGNTNFTYEIFYTLLTQIEATLNSRPLTPLTENPMDVKALTPAHFLISDEMRAFPELDIQSVPSNRLNKWQQIQKIHQQFWQRWSNEYLPLLQQRTKWHKKTNSLKVDDLVLIQDDKVPPMQWPIGRVTKVILSSDKLVRAADIRMSNGQIKHRIVQRLCPLPCN